jgi:hypothetical protein
MSRRLFSARDRASAVLLPRLPSPFIPDWSALSRVAAQDAGLSP